MPANLRTATIELHLPSQLGWERAAMDLAASVARKMGFPADRVEDIRTAVSEATVNAIEHGNRQDATRKVLMVLMPAGERLEISVRDQSPTPFATSDGPIGAAPKLEDKLAGLAEARGWGMFLIRQLVDEVECSSTGGGNQVRMVVHLKPRRSGPHSRRRRPA
jgi:serine/threonine-protein kinase RsbW